MADVIVAGKVDPMSVSRAARTSGFSGRDSRAQVVRYSLARWMLGLSHEQALEKSGRNPLNVEPGMMVNSGQVNAKIDAELLREIETSPLAAQFRNRSHMIRYVLYRSDDYSHEEAMEEAYREHGGARKKIEA